MEDKKDYKKNYYSDLPKEVADLLINTHPLMSEEEKTFLPGSSESSETSRHGKESKEEYTDDDFDLSREIEWDLEQGGHYTSDRETVKPRSGPGLLFSATTIAATIIFSVCLVGFMVYSNNQLKKQIMLQEVALATQIDMQKSYISSLAFSWPIFGNESEPVATAPVANADDDLPEPSSDLSTESQTLAETIAENIALPTTYTVVSGDNLSKIARRFYGDAKKMQPIIDANNITDPNTVQVGKQLTIPALE